MHAHRFPKPRHRHFLGRGGCGLPLFEQYPLKTDGKPMGSYVDSGGNLVGFAQTPGYETYRGLGWYGVVTQKRTA